MAVSSKEVRAILSGLRTCLALFAEVAPEVSSNDGDHNVTAEDEEEEELFEPPVQQGKCPLDRTITLHRIFMYCSVSYFDRRV